ncbi:hypothetical protein KUCAC02_025064, partial [Chaenocephalus aceratus]
MESDSLTLMGSIQSPLSSSSSLLIFLSERRTKPQETLTPVPVSRRGGSTLSSLLPTHSAVELTAREAGHTEVRVLPQREMHGVCGAIGEPVRLEWFNPQGERILPSKRMALHSETSRSRLIIYNAIIEDAGIYRCQATDANGHTEEASSNATAKERGEQKEPQKGRSLKRERLTFRDVQSPQEFRHGETAEVVCDVISSPVPVVVWYYQDRRSPRSTTVTLDTPSPIETKAHVRALIRNNPSGDQSGRGVYRCEASVEARGEIDFVDIAMVVNVPPVLSVFQPAFNATADYQESVTFTCMTSGSPDPLVTWHRKGQQLEPSEQYIIARLDGGRSMLTIRNIRQGDGGTYTCRATNKAGSQEREIFLKVF